jgi:hypothetical protein
MRIDGGANSYSDYTGLDSDIFPARVRGVGAPVQIGNIGFHIDWFQE